MGYSSVIHVLFMFYSSIINNFLLDGGASLSYYDSGRKKKMNYKVTLECNDTKCQSMWSLVVDPDRVSGNRLMGLEFCPLCGRYDSHYIVEKERIETVEKT